MSDKIIVVKVPEDTTMEEYEEIKRLLKQNPASLIVPANFEIQVISNKEAMVEYELQRQEPEIQRPEKKISLAEFDKYIIIGLSIFALGVLANMFLEALFL